MPHPIRETIAIIAILILGACASPHQVSYFDAVAAKPEPQVMRVYIDAEGSVYPRENVRSASVVSAHWNGSLFQHYRSDDEICEDASTTSEIGRLCLAIKPPADASQPDPASYVDPQFPIESEWHRAQQSILESRGREIARRAANASMRSSNLMPEQSVTIVVLIHGFNNLFAEAVPSFAQARKLIAEASDPRENLMFVEIFWDGCAIPGGIRCWGKAQASGPLAGFAMRPMFNAMNDELAKRGRPSKIRILSHSSGAFVLGSTLGNPGEVLPLLKKPKRFGYRRFARFASSADGAFAVPQFHDLAVLMLAPATTVKTFGGGEREDEGTLSRDMRLYYGINPDDSVINKKFVGCSIAGVTCMAAKYDDYCDHLHANERLMRRGIRVAAYDLKRDQNGSIAPSEHAFEGYLQQIGTETSMLADFLAPKEDPVVGDDRVTC